MMVNSKLINTSISILFGTTWNQRLATEAKNCGSAFRV